MGKIYFSSFKSYNNRISNRGYVLIEHLSNNAQFSAKLNEN